MRFLLLDVQEADDEAEDGHQPAEPGIFQAETAEYRDDQADDEGPFAYECHAFAPLLKKEGAAMERVYPGANLTAVSRFVQVVRCVIAPRSR